MTLVLGEGWTPPGSAIEKAKAELDAQGYCVVENVLSSAEIAALRARLVEQAAGERERGVAFHDGGAERPNQRVWMLVNKGRVFRDLMLHPVIDTLIGHMLGPDFLLSSLTANIAGPDAYPPTPMTTSGLYSVSIRPETQRARGRSNMVLARVIRLTFFRAPTLMSSSGYPAWGTRRVSMPRAVPMKRTSAANCFLS